MAFEGVGYGGVCGLQPQADGDPDDRTHLIELLQKQDDGDFLRAVAEAVLQLLMEHDVEGLVGAGRNEGDDLLHGEAGTRGVRGAAVDAIGAVVKY